MAATVHRTPAGWRCGESHQNAKYSDDDVLAVRDLHDKGFGWRRIARQLSLHPEWVQKVCAFSRRPFVRMKWPPADGTGTAERLR